MSDKMVVLFMFLILEMLYMFAVLLVSVFFGVSLRMRNSPTGAGRSAYFVVLY